MTRRPESGAGEAESTNPVAVHGCVPLGPAAPPVEIAPQTMRGVVAGRAAPRFSSPSHVPELGDTTPIRFDLAPQNLRVPPSLPIAAVELRAAALSPKPEGPALRAMPARAEPPAVIAPRQPAAVLAQTTLPLTVVAPRQPAAVFAQTTLPLGATRAPRVAAPAPEAAPAPVAVPVAASASVAAPAPVAATATAPAAAPPPRALAPAPPPPVAPSPPALPAQPAANHLFRREALHGVASPQEVKLPQPSAYGWGVLLVIASLTLFIFGGAAIAKIEVTVVAAGALRDHTGLRAVAASLPGAVAEVLVRAGDEVQEGQVLARLDVAQLEANLKLHEQELAVLEKENAVAERADAEYGKQMARALRQRRAVMHQRTGLNRALKGQRKDQLERMRQSVHEGVASLNQELDTREALQQALEGEQLLRSGIADIDIQLAEIEDRMENRALARRTEHARAVAAVAAARTVIEQSTIVAPASGRVESLLVGPGSVVAAGQLLAQIVPGGAPRSIVAFLPSRETAFVSVGSLARVEVEALPVNEFGQAHAMVTRISTDIAKPEELVAQFGEGVPGSFVRVELELVPGSETDEMAPHLRSGELLKVRLHRRERRIISLMFQFARTWMGQ